MRNSEDSSRTTSKKRCSPARRSRWNSTSATQSSGAGWQKMAFLLDDTVGIAEPSEAELRVLYGMRLDLVRTPARVSFTQVFFRREDGDGRARASLVALSDGADAALDRL
jgi:hypothetical protein